MNQKNHSYPEIADWIAKVYGLLAVVTIPWTFYLAVTLPERHISNHWDIAWVGLDIGLIFMLFATALCAYLKTPWLALAASSAATFLIIDAWFDVWTAHRGKQLLESLVLALIVELPLAFITARVAFRVISHMNPGQGRHR